MTVSCVIPSYNEARTLPEVLRRLHEVPMDTIAAQQPCTLEVIVVDDGSTDTTPDVMASVFRDHPQWSGWVRYVRCERNQGKGAALRHGLSLASGEILMIQDADLEYHPGDNFAVLLAPFFDDRGADVVYGSRFMAPQSMRAVYYWHFVGNKFITAVTNIATGLILSDIETGYKVMRRSVVERILPHLRAMTFDIEPEITVFVAALNCRVFEVPTTYTSRTFEEGKKISWPDGFRALWRIAVSTYRARVLRSYV